MWMGACDEEVMVFERIAEARREAARAALLRGLELRRGPGPMRAWLSRLFRRRRRHAGGAGALEGAAPSERTA